MVLFNIIGNVTIGAESDSFYEYLVKSYLQFDRDINGLEFFQRIIPVIFF